MATYRRNRYVDQPFTSMKAKYKDYTSASIIYVSAIL